MPDAQGQDKRMREQRHSMETVFTMITFLVYALAMVVFVLLGASVYRSVTEQMQIHQAQRTAESYLREKIRQNDCAGAVSIRELQGRQVLQIEETIQNQKYRTYIYVEDGELRELFLPAGKKLQLQNGTPLFAMQKITFQETENGLLTVCLQTEADHQHTFSVRKRSESV